MPKAALIHDMLMESAHQIVEFIISYENTEEMLMCDRKFLFVGGAAVPFIPAEALRRAVYLGKLFIKPFGPIPSRLFVFDLGEDGLSKDQLPY
jgi:hypothetical protein